LQRPIGERRYEGTNTLLSVGRLHEEKNPLMAVDTLAEFEAADPGRWRLVSAATVRSRPRFASEAARSSHPGAISANRSRSVTHSTHSLVDLIATTPNHGCDHQR